jgi:hypothetical protein
LLSIENYFGFEYVKNKFEPIGKEVNCFLPQKLSKICFRDPGSEIRDSGKTYPGSRD